MSETLYKVLVNGASCHGGDMKWSLPNGRPGKWHSVKGDIEICSSGLHLTRKPHLWFKWNCEMYEAEGKGQPLAERDDKVVFRSARLLKRVEPPAWWQNALRFVTDEIPKTTFLKPDGEPLKKWKLFTGNSWDAAWAAARDAARAAAWAAARDAAGDAARDAAGAAAWAAARDAAWDAAWDAARDAAGDAAWAAAWAAARDAARAARDAARAARDAAGDAWDAAGAAARAARLKAYYHIVSDLDFKDKAKHQKHVDARWQVWQKGYGLLCDVNGVLYVYAKNL